MKRTSAGIRPHPDLPMSHPGEFLPEVIEAMNITKSELAKRLGVTRKALYDVLDGKSAVSASMALKLEKVIGSSAEFWLGLQMQHDLWKARQTASSGTKKKKAA